MLGKVFKYEMRGCARSLGPIFGMGLAISALLRLALIVAPYIWEPAGAILEALAGSLGGLLLVAIVILAVVFVVMRFFKSMVGAESYLTNTLPVKAGTHITARVLAHTIWCVLAVLAAFVCGLVLIPGFVESLFGASFTLTSNGAVVEYTLFTLPANILWSIIGMVVVFGLVTVVSTLLKFYSSIALGTKLTGSKVGGSFLGYLILNYAQLIVLVPLILLPMVAVIGPSNQDFMNYFTSLSVAGDSLATLSNMMGALWLFTGVVCAINLVFTAISWWLTWFFLGKRLNLD